MKNRNEIAANIQRARTEKAITQEKLACMIGVTQQQVSNWETGKADVDWRYWEGMHEILGLDLMELYIGIPEKSRKEKEKMQNEQITEMKSPDIIDTDVLTEAPAEMITVNGQPESIRSKFEALRESGSDPILLHVGKKSCIVYGDGTENLNISSFGLLQDNKAVEDFTDIATTRYLTGMAATERFLASELVKACGLYLNNCVTMDCRTWRDVMRLIMAGHFMRDYDPDIYRTAEMIAVRQTPLDYIFEEITRYAPESMTVRHYEMYRAGHTMCLPGHIGAMIIGSAFEEDEETIKKTSAAQFTEYLDDAKNLKILVGYEQSLQGECFKKYLTSVTGKNMITKSFIRNIAYAGRD